MATIRSGISRHSLAASVYTLPLIHIYTIKTCYATVGYITVHTFSNNNK